ncbi:phenylalanine--tRNA ligase subunit beta [Geobacter pelophilus]|uniref:Phenylalanine--tRNA ligase beta subunit n=1 Tax=Geoanaerobacter pelophilus TaxID=60036 RepID=A0AAW4L1E2_9BACT|nr:phenylalanine--tRNA ligase subunit beta [Geoanaerobacter pelophilus]MBT0664529.1 phenylalanine--tRNA ligase subunit beta [Geoanaerobacter pelophilus]
MIISYNWLKEFVEVDLSPADLSAMLTMLGLEVERVEERFTGMDSVVVAQVQEKAQHPNADKLSVCKVNNGSEILDIVCGAQNFKAGDKVALAQIGTVLPGDFKIKRSKIRGEESLGMLCSEKELGIADESAGIMILPADLVLGTPVFDALGMKDVIFEIGLTPNRSDCLSVIGIAREVAAKLGKKITQPEIQIVEESRSALEFASVVTEDADLCPRYAARYIKGCKIGPSPAWLVGRLNAVGMRSINNVVDVTNYVLMEYGHPLHAFDHDQLVEGRIVVRRAAAGEQFITLDGQERTLTADDLTIRDGARAVALAGIMGGQNSEISDTTTNILLESAWFNPSAIRRTSKRLGIHSESSHRFERGADIEAVPRALDRAASLICQLAGGSIAAGMIDVYPVPLSNRIITLRHRRVEGLLGVFIAPDVAQSILESLECAVTAVDSATLQVTVPSYRVDLEREIDLIEELARMYGYDNIPVTMPYARVVSDRPPLHQRIERKVRDLLVSYGFNEVVNFSFSPLDVPERMLLAGDDHRATHVKLLNPLIDEHSVMRTTLLPGLLETSARNANFRVFNQRIFELRRVYLVKPEHDSPCEPLVLGGLISGLRNPEGWNQGKGEADFFDAKGVVENILDALKVPAVKFEPRDIEPFYHPGKACTIFAAGERIGSIGEIHPTVQENYAIEKPVYYFELEMGRLILLVRETTAITAPSRFPDASRDIAMLLPDAVSADSINDCISTLKIKEIEEVSLFDLYKGEHIPEGHKSIAIRVRYRLPDRTLTDEEVSALHQRVVNALVNNIGASIR